jgi:hypothetical protein
MTHLILTIIFLVFLGWLCYKFVEANERVKQGIRRRTGPQNVSELRRRR